MLVAWYPTYFSHKIIKRSFLVNNITQNSIIHEKPDNFEKSDMRVGGDNRKVPTFKITVNLGLKTDN